MSNIHKSFGSTLALRGVNLEVLPGEVHALVGENGAGKSTLMKVLSGALVPERGEMRLADRPFHPPGPGDARQAGIAMIYQELALAPHLNVETNIMLGLENHRWGFVRRSVQRRRVQEALKLLAHPEIKPETPVHRLSPGACQLVEVARALVSNARIIVFDEPTSSLTHGDTETLFTIIRRLQNRGVSILYISHFLEEVKRIADRYSVLRDGQSIATGDAKNVSSQEIIRQMVGRSLQELFPRVPHNPGRELLTVHRLAGEKLPVEVSFRLRRGEILGIFGLVGAGRTELLRVLFGLDPLVQGEMVVNGKVLTARAPSKKIAAGMGILSEDRKHEGLALMRSIADNLTYSWLTPYLKMGLLQLGKRRHAVLDWLKQLRVRHRDPDQRIGELSGGNQQKVALGRLLHQQAEILLLDEPTRGVDVGSKTAIFRLMGELAAQGKAILFVSSYLPELMGVCDTLAVMARGRLSSLRPVSEWSEDRIMAFATGGNEP